MSDTLQHHLAHLCADRARAVAERERWSKQVDGLNKQLLTALRDVKSVREQLLDGTVITIIQPKDRQTVLPEKLLAFGVDPDIIRGATKDTPVAPFVRVDAPKSGAEDAAGEGTPFLTPDPVSDNTRH